jgi:hypothetical protein
MIGNWTTWKKFPNAQRGEHVEAPIGPGLFEVRYVSTGDLAAFDAAPNVAAALAALVRRPQGGSWWRLFSAEPAWQGHDVEYRTCAAASYAEAKFMVERLLGRRQVYYRRSAPHAANYAGSY